ncbi:hypothetical protein KAR91_54855 [Candidatus Pacearchaeota archaeon]|nr:hypothetical protein [Candidatus Pacearchaeota archaeon]
MSRFQNIVSTDQDTLPYKCLHFKTYPAIAKSLLIVVTTLTVTSLRQMQSKYTANWQRGVNNKWKMYTNVDNRGHKKYSSVDIWYLQPLTIERPDVNSRIRCQHSNSFPLWISTSGYKEGK